MRSTSYILLLERLLVFAVPGRHQTFWMALQKSMWEVGWYYHLYITVEGDGIWNRVACLIVCWHVTSRFEHLTPILWELHWLPIIFCAKFKVLLVTYKALFDLWSENLNNHFLHHELCLAIKISGGGSFLGVTTSWNIASMLHEEGFLWFWHRCSGILSPGRPACLPLCMPSEGMWKQNNVGELLISTP